MVPVKRLWIAVKPVSNGEPCAKRCDRHQEKQGKSNRSWTRALRLKKALDLTNGLDSEPTWHLHLPQYFRSAACGANVTGLNDAVQQLLVTLLFLGGITDEHDVATK